MLKTSLAGLRAHKLRLLLTALAITLGVGFIAGTFILTDTMQAGIDKKFSSSASKVDAAVLPKKDSGTETLPAALLAKIRALPGVADAQGGIRGDAALIGKDGKAYGDTPTVGISVPPGRLQRYDITRGRAPATSNEAVLDERTARKSGFKVGDTVRVLDHRGAAHPFTLTGLADFGVDSEVGFRGGVGFTPGTTAQMTGERNHVEIDVDASGDPARVRDAMAGTVGGSYDVLTSRELGDRLARAAGANTKIIRAGLLIFGLVSMLVSALVIYNTFSILIAQRMREMALLRCVGATRRQVFGGVLVESAVVGLVGSMTGLGLGLGLAAGGLALFGGLDSGLPTSGFTLTPRTIIVGLLVGVLVTVLSALLPARAATRVAPIAALRSELEPGNRRFRLGWVRTALAALFGVLGLGLGALGPLAMDKGTTAMNTVALGGCLVFLAVIALMPALVRPLGRLIGALPARLAGVPGRLAVQNARRAPRRTATTTIALTIGVGLMSLFAVVAAGGKASAEHSLQRQFPVDFQLQTQFGGERKAAVPRGLAVELRKHPEFASVTELREKEVKGGDTVGTVTQASIGSGSIKPEVKSGSFGDLRPGTVAVEEGTAKERHLTVGQTVPIGKTSLQVAAIFGGDTPLAQYVVPEADFDRYFGPLDDRTIFVKLNKGVDNDAGQTIVERAANPYPMVKVGSAAGIKDSFNKAIDTMLVIFGGLLGLAIIIALFGIANTLTLSVVERTRESALLRALGITKRQLRRMLSIEAFIMAVIGALTGVVLGVGFGWAATEAMAASSIFAVPYLQVIGFVVMAGAAGMLAAVLPARRAAKTSIVESLTHD